MNSFLLLPPPYFYDYNYVRSQKVCDAPLHAVLSLCRVSRIFLGNPGVCKAKRHNASLYRRSAIRSLSLCVDDGTISVEILGEVAGYFLHPLITPPIVLELSSTAPSSLLECVLSFWIIKS